MREIVHQAISHGAMPTAHGERPRLIITATAETLRTGTGFGRTSTGEDLSGETVRRIGCDADVYALLLTEHGAPLKLGRRRRTISPAQWIAICVRDTGCVFPGCTRPAAYCEGHHLQHWGDFGFTDDDNLALLCRWHHDLIHHGAWEIFLAADRRPWLRPPDWIDPNAADLASGLTDRQATWISISGGRS